MNEYIRKHWEQNKKLIEEHWGELKTDPQVSELANYDSFKTYLMDQYGWDGNRADEELKWLTDFTRTFESK